MEVGEQRRRDRVVDAVREALVPRLGDAAEADELVAAAGAERLRPVAQEVAEAVAAEGVELVRQPPVDTDVHRVLLERFRGGGHVVVAYAVVASGGVRGGDRVRVRLNGIACLPHLTTVDGFVPIGAQDSSPERPMRRSAENRKVSLLGSSFVNRT